MRKKVELITFAASWEWQGRQNHNFVIKFTGAIDTPEKLDRYVYVASENPQTKFVVGQEIDFDLSKDKENKQKTIKVNLGGKSFEFDKIEPAKAAFVGGGFGGNGGGKAFSKSPEIFKNELVSFVSGYAQQILCHRINLGKDANEIVAAYETLVDGMYKASVKHIK